jgi:hypothetical protein
MRLHRLGLEGGDGCSLGGTDKAEMTGGGVAVRVGNAIRVEGPADGDDFEPTVVATKPAPGNE